MACYVEGIFLDIYQVPQTLGTGSNLVCTVVWLALARLFDMFGGPTVLYIDVLLLSLDNCVGENKNNIVMAFLGCLVLIGVVGRVEVNFMQVGHTHIKIDQIFSRYG
ncbi:unnamed protein product [Pylaiella littoralis]